MTWIASYCSALRCVTRRVALWRVSATAVAHAYTLTRHDQLLLDRSSFEYAVAARSHVPMLVSAALDDAHASRLIGQRPISARPLVSAPGLALVLPLMLATSSKTWRSAWLPAPRQLECWGWDAPRVRVRR